MMTDEQLDYLFSTVEQHKDKRLSVGGNVKFLSQYIDILLDEAETGTNPNGLVSGFKTALKQGVDIDSCVEAFISQLGFSLIASFLATFVFGTDDAARKEFNKKIGDASGEGVDVIDRRKLA